MLYQYALVPLAFVLGACHGNRLTVAQVDQQIADALPVGTDQARALTVLDSLKLEHSAFNQKTQTIAAMIPDSSKKGMITRSFHIVLHFDSAGKLTSHTTQELFTGP